jgi:Sugar phosphate isomerases/epimerases
MRSNRGLGFTTQTFMKLIETNAMSTGEALKWAAACGFSWVEVRDPFIGFSKKYISDLIGLGDSLGLKLHYAWDTCNLLDAGNADILEKGLNNAAVFGEGTFSRVTIAYQNIIDIPWKLGYTKEEFDKLRIAIKKCIHMADAKGIKIVFENGGEPLYGDQAGYYGIGELLDEIPDMKLAFDPANLLNKQETRAVPRWDEVIEFSCKFKDQIPYMHVKATKDNILLDNLILDGDIDYHGLMGCVRDGTMICLELPSISDKELCMKNVLDAMHLLSKMPEEL